MTRSNSDSSRAQRRAFVITAFAGVFAPGCDHRANSTASSQPATDAGAPRRIDAAAPAIPVDASAADSASDSANQFIGLAAPGVGLSGGRMGGSPSLSALSHGRGLIVPGGRMGGSIATPGMVRIGQPTAHGPAAPEMVRRIVLRNLGQLHHCYERGIQAQPTLAGSFTVRFVIDASGAVASASPADDAALRASQVPACAASAVRRWTFPAATATTTVSLPITLSLQQ